MSNITTRIAALGVAGAMALTGVASASAGHRSYARTYPIASTLCAKVAAGQTPKRLKGQETQVTAACGALQTNYTQAVNTALTAEQTYKAGALSARTQAQQTCRQTPKPRHGACLQARRSARQSIRLLRQDLRIAAIRYHQSIETARQSFWSTIHSLRGGATMKSDAPQPNAPLPAS
jgi:hypothetical protein